MYITYIQLFQTTKIQIFESNSQQLYDDGQADCCCFRLQRYKFLKAIHNFPEYAAMAGLLFQTTKIQIFESNSQRNFYILDGTRSCFRLQRYKFLKAIHNNAILVKIYSMLFQTTKIQIFESNSQPVFTYYHHPPRCFRLQRYKFLKAIHNACYYTIDNDMVVSDYKDTNF